MQDTRIREKNKANGSEREQNKAKRTLAICGVIVSREINLTAEKAEVKSRINQFFSAPW